MASEWYPIFGIVGSVASIISIILFLVKHTWLRRAAAIVLILLTAFFIFLAYHRESPLDVKIYIHSGTYQVDQFLKLLSIGPSNVIINPDVGAELRRRGIRIKTSGLKDVSLKYVLDKIVSPQLPGPEQWSYEVEGKTVRLIRRLEQ